MAKRILIVLSVLLSILLSNNIYSNPQNNLSSFASLLEKGSSVDFLFTAVDAQGNNIYSDKGSVFIYSKSYKMQTPQYLIVSNSEKKWVYKKDVNEILVSNCNSSSVDIMDNPFAILSNNSDKYKISIIGEYSKDVPKKIVLKAKTGTVYTIEILQFESLSLDNSMFIFNASDYEDAVVVELD